MTVDGSRRQAIDRMFRARLSWTLIGAIGLIGLTSGLGVAVRGALFALGLAGFVWLNQPLLAWVLATRRAGDERWQPAAVGMVLRVVGLAIVLAVSW